MEADKVWEAIIEIVLEDSDAWVSATERIFKQFDRDSSGDIDLDELVKGLDDLGVKTTEAQRDAFLKEIDRDFCGCVSLKEWSAAIELHMPRLGAEVEAWRVLLTAIDDDQSKWKESVETLFRTIDADNSGEIDIEELKRALYHKGIKITDDQLLSLSNDIDSDGDGRINMSELLFAVEKLKPRPGEGPGSSVEGAWQAIISVVVQDTDWSRSLPALFRAFDRDGSGAIDCAELASGLVSLGVKLQPDQVMALRDILDTNKDGIISMSEFSDAVKKKLAVTESPNISLEPAWTAIVKFALINPEKWRSSSEKLFLKFDIDSSGMINIENLCKGIRSLGVKLTAPQLDALMQDLDKDFSGSISLDEAS